MRLDRKLLLIAPSIVLFFVISGIVYAAGQLHVLASVSDTLKERSDFIASVERGQRTLDERQTLGILRYSLEVEARRTAAIAASRDLLLWLAGIAFVSLAVLVAGIRGVPREHWPRLSVTGRGDAP